MIVLLIGGVCCCCVLLSAVFAGLYFFVDSVKMWVDDLLGIESPALLAKKWKEKKCHGNHVVLKNNSWGCYNPMFSYRTSAAHTQKNKTESVKVVDPWGVQSNFYDQECVTTQECKDIVDKVKE